MSFADYALSYLEKGIPVFPCNAQNKRPLTENGFHDASSDADTVRAWWDRWPNAMIGVPTGEQTGFWVLDIDDPESFEGACSIDLPPTRRVDTGKGYHLYFRFDPAKPVRNAQKTPKGWPFPSLPGAETRGDGGYVIVPPSIHPSGREYKWHDDAPMALAPSQLLKIVRKEERVAPQQPLGSTEKPIMAATARDSAYGVAALEAECETISEADDGEQEGALNEGSLKIGALVAGGELSIDTARQKLVAAGLAMTSYDGRNPWTAEEIMAKVIRGLADGARSPRCAPLNNVQTCPAARDAAGLTEYASDPVNLWARYEPPALPEGLLPKVIEDFARAQAEMMGVDPAGLAMAAIGVCGATISDRITVQVKEHDPTWRESARLWIALIGPPSVKKSPVMLAAARPLNKIDAALFRKYAHEKAAYDALPATERKATSAPKQKRLRITDATIEAAQEVLKDSPDGVMSLQDELSGWFGAMDKYAPGKGAMADRSFWLQAFNGGSYALNRVTRGATVIPNLSISVLGGIQPGPLRKLVGDAVDDGLIQRLLPVMLAPASVGMDAPRAGEAVRYENMVARLHLLSPPLWDGTPMRVEISGDLPLRFDAQAQVIRRELEHKHHAMMAAESISPKMASHFGKYDGIFARLCVIWHCIEHHEAEQLPTIITASTAGRAADFLHGFIAKNAVAFYVGTLGLADDHEELVEFASFILASKKETVQVRDIQRASRSLRSLDGLQAKILCEKLESLGWLSPCEPPKNSRTPHWTVNPLVHQRFAEHGAQEAERRRRAREAIAEVFNA